jgi:hypothetical protein
MGTFEMIYLQMTSQRIGQAEIRIGPEVEITYWQVFETSGKGYKLNAKHGLDE